MKKIIHVNKAIIAHNNKNPNNIKPPITVKTYKTNTYCHSVEILGSCIMTHSPHKPLSCGAKVWIETEADVICHDSINTK